jgi:peptidoglycan/LPS O-acetylase OafA/YrhL
VRRFRPDVEGLRAVAITLVLLFHAGLPVFRSGYVGVDVFFVISGFLITGMLLAELRRTNTISLLAFYGRRVRRLLPAAGVVLVATFVLVRFVLPNTRWSQAGGDILSSALYVVNWRLADRSVDYLAEGTAASPVQHFWSLAVEEQYYLVWPLLLLLAVRLARRRGLRSAPVLWAGLALVVIPSFVWSVVESAEAAAFYQTTTRMWELGIGAAVAFGARIWSRVPRDIGVGIGWAGLLAIAGSGVVFSTQTPWPGSAALVPVLGTAAVIVAGYAAGAHGPAALLSTGPFQRVGGLSYSLYLWHWPLLVVAAGVWDDHLPVWAGLAVVAASAVPAWLTYRWVENPVRYSKVVSRSVPRTWSLAAAFTMVGAGLSLLLFTTATQAVVPRQGALGAAVLRDSPRGDPAGAPVDHVDWMVPTPAQATSDVPAEYALGCQQKAPEAKVVPCGAGKPDGKITVAVVGDSKATQWLPALQLLANQNDWKIISYLKSSCAFTLATTAYQNQPFEECRAWTDAVLATLMAAPPDYLITSQDQSVAYAEDGSLSTGAMIDGLRAVWHELTRRGTKVVVIADTPRPDGEVYDCVARNPTRMSVCSFEGELSPSAKVQHDAVQGQADVSLVDLFDAICPTERCAPVIGNVLVYRQGSHLTKTYVETLTPRLAAALTAAGLPTRFTP